MHEKSSTPMGNQTAKAGQPHWWNDHHTSAWERVKASLRRDWEQTKHDLGVAHARDLHQDAGDTIAQATGSQPVPGRVQADDDWSRREPALRYGYGAYSQYGQGDTGQDWSADTSTRLGRDWDQMKSGRTWDEVKADVRRGWDAARRKL